MLEKRWTMFQKVANRDTMVMAKEMVTWGQKYYIQHVVNSFICK